MRRSRLLVRELASRGVCFVTDLCKRILACLLGFMPTLFHSQLDCPRRTFGDVQQKARLR